MDTEVPTRSKLALKGSSKIVSDYFEFSIHNILYQRGIYSADDFKIVKKYGLNLLISMDPDVINYIKRIIKQLHRWIYSGKINKLVLVITSKETGEVVEKWVFNIEVDKANLNRSKNDSDKTDDHALEIIEKPIEQIQREIQAIIRQITASITFLPELDGPHTFNILVYTDLNCKVPEDWEDLKESKEINGSGIESVKFKSFSTQNHSVSTFVTYKVKD